MLDDLFLLLLPETRRGWALLGVVLGFVAAAALLAWAVFAGFR